MHKLVLASNSPRRRDLLEEAGFCFHVDSVKLSEIIDKNLNPRAVAESLARAKAEAYVKEAKPLKNNGFLILSADTIVVLDGAIMGKPKNSPEAQLFLRQLSAKTHSVITGVCVYDVDNCRSIVESDETLVTFRPLTEDEILAYVQSGEPMDKAGAYAIQGEGGKFVMKTEGSYSNIVGLPIELFKKLVKDNGWNFDRQ